jgi:hypothetical protein
MTKEPVARVQPTRAGAAASGPAAKRSRRGGLRLIWLIPAALALLSGLDAGLLLLGVPAPVNLERLPEVHGMLLVIGFVATLVSLERASALGRWYGYAAPALLAAGAVCTLTPLLPLIVGKAVLAAGMAAFMFLYVPLWRRQFDAPLLTQLLATGCGLAASIMWIGGVAMAHLIPWLIGFLVLTIAAERVELARITIGKSAGTRLLVHAYAVTVSLLIGVAYAQLGAIMLGLSLLALVAWLAVHDVARHTVKAQGATRYMAACILCGYVWLFLASIVLLFGLPESGSPAYDAVIHASFLGYTFSMIMAHATTILPAVLHINLPYRWPFWIPICVLQAGLLLRIWVGDGLSSDTALKTGGVLNVVALLLFAATAVTSAVMGPARSQPASPRVQRSFPAAEPEASA